MNTFLDHFSTWYGWLGLAVLLLAAESYTSEEFARERTCRVVAALGFTFLILLEQITHSTIALSYFALLTAIVYAAVRYEEKLEYVAYLCAFHFIFWCVITSVELKETFVNPLAASIVWFVLNASTAVALIQLDKATKGAETGQPLWLIGVHALTTRFWLCDFSWTPYQFAYHCMLCFITSAVVWARYHYVKTHPRRRR